MKVYVAGPDVFLSDAVDQLEHVRDLLASHGMKALIPLDNDEDLNFSDKLDTAQKIYKGNVKMIDQADAVLANIQPFRGDHMDPGTAFEIGYAIAKGKPVYCYTTYAKSEMVNRIEGTVGDGRHWDFNGMSVEDFGMTENLMITVPARGVYETLLEAVLRLKDEQSKG